MEKQLQKTSTQQILNWISLIVIAGLFLRYWQDDPERFYPQVRFLITLLILTIATRTITARYSLAVYARGLFIGVGATLLLGAAYTAMGFDIKNGFFGTSILFPIIEEAAKLLPVFISLYFFKKNYKSSFNPSDWLLQYFPITK